MKKLLFLFLLISSFASAQTVTGAKTRFPGIWYQSKDTAAATPADSLAVIWQRSDSSLYVRANGYWKKIAANVGGFLQISDTAAMLSHYPNYTATNSMLALKLNISDTALLGGTNYYNKTYINSRFGNVVNTDTSFVGTNYFNKTYVTANLALKLNYTDTSTALANYVRTSNWGLTKTGQALGVDSSLVATRARLTASLIGYASDALVVHLAGAETITGAKTFTSDLIAGQYLTVGLGGGSVSTNTMLGYQAGLVNNTGVGFNTFVGYQSGMANTTSNANTFVGYQAGVGSLTGGSNVALGYSSAYGFTAGLKNVFLGANAGRYIADGTTANALVDNSIYIGYNTKALANNQTNQIVIGYNETGLGSNTTILGNSSTAQTAIRGNVTLGGTTNDGASILWATGKTRLTGLLTLDGSITASSAIARGEYNNTTLVAAANNDVLVGLDISPTFTNGAFTGVSNYGLRISGSYADKINLVNTTGTNQISLKNNNNALAAFGVNGAGDLFLYNNSTNPIVFYVNAVERARFSTGGRFLLNTLTDNGNDIIQANGSGKFVGNLTSDVAADGYAVSLQTNAGNFFASGVNGSIVRFGNTYGFIGINKATLGTLAANSLLIGGTTNSAAIIDNSNLPLLNAQYISSTASRLVLTGGYRVGTNLTHTNDFTITAPLGTGTGTSADIVLYTGVAGTTGTTQNTTSEIMRVKSSINTILIGGGGSHNGVPKLDVTGKGYFTDTLQAGTIARIGGTSSQYLMADGSVSTISGATGVVATGTLTAQTTGQNIATYTAPSDGMYMIGGQLRYNSGTGTSPTVDFQYTYTDENNTAQSFELFAIGSGSNGGAAYTAGWSPKTIYVKSGTVITIKTGILSGTPNYNAQGFIQKIF